MKKIVIFVTVLFACAGTVLAQTTTPTTSSEPEIPLRLKLMDKMGRQSFNRYVLLPTSVSYVYYELDTVTGRIWSVEFGGRSKDRRKILMNDEDLRGPLEREEEVIGRFELVPTNNSFYYLMVDGHTGRAWQVERKGIADKKNKKAIIEIK